MKLISLIAATASALRVQHYNATNATHYDYTWLNQTAPWNETAPFNGTDPYYTEMIDSLYIEHVDQAVHISSEDGDGEWIRVDQILHYDPEDWHGSDDDWSDGDWSDDDWTDDDWTDDDWSDDDSDSSSGCSCADSDSDDEPEEPEGGCQNVGYEEDDTGRREWCEDACVWAGGLWVVEDENHRGARKESCTNYNDDDETAPHCYPEYQIHAEWGSYCDTFCGIFGGMYDLTTNMCDWSLEDDEFGLCQHVRLDTMMGYETCDTWCAPTGGHWETIEEEWGPYETCVWPNISSAEIY